MQVTHHSQRTKLKICFTIIQFAVRLAYETRQFEACLKWIQLDRNLALGDAFLREKMECFYYLKKYKEFIYFFRTKFALLESQYDLHLKAGLSLHALGKYKESEAILNNIPEKANLPSFKEKKKAMQQVIDNIPVYETKSTLSFEDLRELGFAYLFNSQFKKAEEAFKKAAETIK
ncbi:MAG: hypothetical protein AAF518_15485 [Spirochaetota bacterium]